MKRVLFLAMCLAVASAAYAQNGAISGRVTDASGGVLPGVTVTLMSSTGRAPLTAVTSETGTYQFPGLPIGTYSMKFELGGFRTVARENIVIEIGFTAQINAELAIGAVEQSIEVTGASPVVDVKSTTQGARFDADMLASLPSGGGDQKNLIEQAPGVANSTKDVGGNTNGSTQGFAAHGADANQTRFLMDGTDISPAGNNQAFWMDFQSLQEVQVTLSGADASVQASGAYINMVSKSGSDTVRGSGYLHFEDERLEGTNQSDALRQQLALPGASPGNPLQHYVDTGFEIGGPLKKGRVWFWAESSKQVSTLGDYNTYDTSSECASVAANQLSFAYSEVRRCTHSDPVVLKHAGYKIGIQLFHGNQFNFTNRYDVKEQAQFLFSPLQPAETTRRLTSPCDPSQGAFQQGPCGWDTGWPATWKFADQHIVNDRLLIDLGFSHFGKNNQMALHDDALLTVQPMFEQSTSQFSRSYFYQANYQPYNAFDVASNYFMPGKWGGDHTIKAGVQYQRYENENLQDYGGHAQAIFNSAATVPAFTTAFSANLYRQGLIDAFLYHDSAYFQDSYTRKRLTLNLGLRWDRQDDSIAAENVPASPFQGQITQTGTPFAGLPAVIFPGAQGGVVWNTFGPRLGVTYDLNGNGKTVLRASYNLYFDSRTAGMLADVYDTIGVAASGQGITQSFVQYPWTDLNGDKSVQMNEVNTTTARSFGGNYNAANPTSTTSPNSVDPNIKDPRTDEFTFGVSRELAADFGINVNYIYRKYTNFIWKQLNGISSDNYSSVTFTPAATACPAGARCDTVTYFVPNIPVPSAYTLANQPDYYRKYQGLEFILRRRFRNNWTMNASYVYNTNPVFYLSPASYQDPTNIAQQNGAQSTASNTKHVVRMSGSYRLPWQHIGISAVLDLRQGFTFSPTIQSPARPNSAGVIAVLLDPPGTSRLPTLKDLDIRIDKQFTAGKLKIAPEFGVFNLFNQDTVLGQSANQNASTANRITSILGPRVARLAFRVTF